VPFDYCHQNFEWKAPPLIAFNTLPDSDWMSAGEAIAWIAFRHAWPAEYWDELPAWKPQQQWPSYDSEFEGLLEARAKRAPWRPTTHSIFGPDHWRAQLRAVERKSGLTATALLPIFHQDRARYSTVEATFKAAGRALVSAVAAGSIPAFGRRQKEFAVDDPKASLTEIPPEIFAQPVTIEPAGFIGWDTRGIVFQGPFFGDIRFRTTDIARIWPPARVDDSPRPPARLEDLPAGWTLLETLAWIVFRDPSIVRDASLETPREATEYWEQVRTGSGNTILALVQGEPGVSRLRLTLMRVARGIAEATPDEPATDQAETDLLTRLRAGDIAATGIALGQKSRTTIQPEEWRGLQLADDTFNSRIVIATPAAGEGGTRHSVLLPKDRLLELWPANDAQQATPIAEVVVPMRPRPTVAEVRRWFADRVANWPDDQPAPSEKMDWEAASRHFGDGLRRDQDFRPIREAATPLEWRKQGKRLPWGKVRNSAGNSAKLRRQN